MSGARAALARRTSIIPHDQQFVNRQIRQISQPAESRNCACCPVHEWRTSLLGGHFTAVKRYSGKGLY